METKYQLPDFETYSLTIAEKAEMDEKVVSKVSVLSMHLEALEMLKLDWVQEKLKKRWENLENRDWAEFKI